MKIQLKPFRKKLATLISVLFISAVVITGKIAWNTFEVLTNSIEGLKNSIVAMKVKHKKDIAKTKLKGKAKRLLVGIPVAGIAYGIWLEKSDYDEWKIEHPDGTFNLYTIETAALIDEMKNELVDEYCNSSAYGYQYVCPDEQQAGK